MFASEPNMDSQRPVAKIVIIRGSNFSKAKKPSYAQAKESKHLPNALERINCSQQFMCWPECHGNITSFSLQFFLNAMKNNIRVSLQ